MMSIPERNKDLQIERLIKDSVITLEKRGKTTFPTTMLVHGLGQIGYIEWEHTDPIKSLENMTKIPNEQFLNDTLTQSKIIEASMIPYIAPFP